MPTGADGEKNTTNQIIKLIFTIGGGLNPPPFSFLSYLNRVMVFLDIFYLAN
jgi:hypothetical protein